MDMELGMTNPFTGEIRSIPQGVTVRRGLPEDEASVVELCREIQLYNDYDFLPGLWNKLMANSNCLMIVAEKDGKVLAVSGLLILNKGQSWLEFANRSSPTVRGNNVFWACNAKMFQEALEQYGRPSNLCKVVPGGLKVAMKGRKNGMNFRAVMFNHYFHIGHHMNAESVQTLSDHVSSVAPTVEVHAVPSAAEFAELLSDPDKQFALFPEGYFKTVYCVYEAIPQSAYDVWEGSPMKWAALSKTPNDGELTLSLISAFYVYGGKGINFQVELYGHVDYDITMSHFHHHMPQMLSAYADYEEMSIVFLIPNRFCLKPYEELIHKKLNMPNLGISECAVSVYCDPLDIHT